MKVFIDFTQIPLRKAGVGVYAEALVKNYLTFTEHTFFVLCYSDENCFDELQSNSNITPIKIKLRRNLLLRLFIEQLLIPFLVIKFRCNVIHSLHYSFPLLPIPGCKKVVTIHDMTFFLYPELHENLKRFYFSTFIKFSSFIPCSLIFVSKSTYNDYLTIIKSTFNPVYVIHHGIKDIITKTHSEEISLGILKNFNIEYEYILYIGTIEPRKNILTLIKSFNQVSKSNPNIKLLLCGKKGWYYDSIFNEIDRLKLSSKVNYLGYISDLEKTILLKNALLFVYPSVYEGFGLPVLESMACGTPTITSNISSLSEISQYGAFLLNDPSCPDELSRSIFLFLSSKKLRSEYSKLGIERSRDFSWFKCSTETLKVYAK